MAVVKVYDQDKTEQGELTLTPEVFEVAVRPVSYTHLDVYKRQPQNRSNMIKTFAASSFPHS